MAGIHRLYVDANIFIRLFEGNDELSRTLTDLFLIERTDKEPFLATSELTLAELLVKPYRESDDQLIDLYDNWTISNPYLEVGPVNRQVLWYAALFRAQHENLKLPDAIHLSTAVGMNCTHFLSADKRLSERYVVVHNRYGIVKGPAAVEIVRPSIQGVGDIVTRVREQE